MSVRVKGIDWDNRRAKQKAWREANRESLKIKKRDYYQSHYKLITSERDKAKHKQDPRRGMLRNARSRANKKCLEFDLVIEDINIPTHCPILGIELFTGDDKVHPGSPSLDRIDNSRGYTKDNVQVISDRANRMKNDATFREIELLYLHMKKIMHDSHYN